MISPLKNILPISLSRADEVVVPLDFTGITNYAYFGDSIMNGSVATAGNSFRELLTTNYATTSTNQSVSGRGVWYEANNFNSLSGYVRNNTAVWIEGGLNDLRRSATIQTSNKLQSSLKTMIARAFSGSSAASGSSSVTRTGTFFTYDAKLYGGIYPSGTLGAGNFASYSTTIGDTWTWAFTGDNAHIVFSSGSSFVARGNCEIRIDGNLVETITDASDRWDGVSDGVNDNKRGPDTRFYWDLGAGNHTMEIKVTSAVGVVVDKLGTLDTPSNLGVVAVIQIPYITDYAKVGLDQADDSKIDAGNLLRENIANEFKARGYNIGYCKIMKGKGGLYDLINISGDGSHPTDAGHLQIYNSLTRYIG